MTQKQIRIKKQGTRQSPPLGTPGNPDLRSPSGVVQPY